MLFHALRIDGAFEIELEPRSDARGTFARMFCRDEFASHGLADELAQVSTSWNAARGTLRGLHYQLAPHRESKLVRCTRGALFDVVADVRPESRTFGRWCGVHLAGDAPRMLYVPSGCAHGYVTLTDDTEVLYLIDARYAPGAERGVRWNDPAFAIEWPIDPIVMSEKDRDHPDFDCARRP